MTTATTRLWTFGAIFVMIIVVALGWFLGVSPNLANAARADAERVNVAAQNDLARATIVQLQQDFEQIDELRDDLEALRAEFPTQAQYDDAVEELLTGLLTRGLTLQNFSITEPSPTTPVILEEGENEPEPEIDGDGLLPSGSLLRVPVSVTVTGPFSALIDYIESLQLSTRFAIVSSGSFSGGVSGDTSTMTFSMVIYVVTGDDLANVAVEGGVGAGEGDGDDAPADGDPEGDATDPAEPGESPEPVEPSPSP